MQADRATLAARAVRELRHPDLGADFTVVLVDVPGQVLRNDGEPHSGYCKNRVYSTHPQIVTANVAATNKHQYNNIVITPAIPANQIGKFMIFLFFCFRSSVRGAPAFRFAYCLLTRQHTG